MVEEERDEKMSIDRTKSRPPRPLRAARSTAREPRPRARRARWVAYPPGGRSLTGPVRAARSARSETFDETDLIRSQFAFHEPISYFHLLPACRHGAVQSDHHMAHSRRERASKRQGKPAVTQPYIYILQRREGDTPPPMNEQVRTRARVVGSNPITSATAGKMACEE